MTFSHKLLVLLKLISDFVTDNLITMKEIIILVTVDIKNVESDFLKAILLSIF